MKKIALITGVLILVVSAFLLGTRMGRRAEPFSSGPDDGTLASGSSPEVDGPDEADLAPGTVRVGPEKRQLAGIRIAEVRKEPIVHTLRVLGRVATDESALYVINAATSGWVVRISDVTTGSLVKTDQVLATIYAPDVVEAQQSYVYSLNTLARLKAEGSALPTSIDSVEVSVEQTRSALRNFGMSEVQLDKLARTKVRADEVELRSPATGVVVARNIFPGLKFVPGTEFFRIADLRRVWIFLDVYENEIQFLKPGTRPKVSLAGQNRSFAAVVSDVLPLFDPASRTMKVRLEASNLDYVLRPDMFVDVELPVSLDATLAVPADAILDTGLKRTVFVDRGGGFFEPREVETGRRLGKTVEIIEGLEAGDRIVVSGTFLIDSESRMELAAAGMTGSLSQDPVCGRPVSIKKAVEAGRTAVYDGTTYHFCSDEDRDLFLKDPRKYVGGDGEGAAASGQR